MYTDCFQNCENPIVVIFKSELISCFCMNWRFWSWNAYWKPLVIWAAYDMHIVQWRFSCTVKKRFTSFPSLAGMSLTKLPMGRNNSVMTSLFPPRESLVVTSRLGTGNSRSFFLRCVSNVGWTLREINQWQRLKLWGIFRVSVFQ